MTLDLTHRHGHFVDVSWNDVALFRYSYRPDTAASEAPKPRLHPIRTLGGNVVTIYRPHDHRWHHGLAMTLTEVSGDNFWGGPTFVRDKGYVPMDNVGRQEHVAWRGIEAQGDRAALLEELQWIAASGRTLLHEERAVRVVTVNADDGYWTLEFATRLQNVSGGSLDIGSPTTNGRPNAGYGGLFWRGPRSFRGGGVLGAGGIQGQDDAMGRPGPWLAFVGRHDEVDAASTLVFVDSPGNPRYPTKWFVRSEPYACVSFSFMFDEIYELRAGERLDLTYRIVVADGAWDRERIEEVAAAAREGSASH